MLRFQLPKIKLFTLNMTTRNDHLLLSLSLSLSLSLVKNHMAFPNCIFLLNIKVVLCIKPSMIPTTLYTPPTIAIKVVMNW